MNAAHPGLIVVRRMIPADVAAVTALDEACFLWESWPAWMIEKVRRRAVVATWDAAVVGYAVGLSGKANVLRVVRVGVHPNFRRRGVGAKLVSKVFRQKGTTTFDKTRAVVKLRETEVAAQLFFRRIGFRAYRCEREAFQDTGEDAISMECFF